MAKFFGNGKPKDLTKERMKKMVPLARQVLEMIVEAELPMGDLHAHDNEKFNMLAKNILQLMLENEVKYIDKHYHTKMHVIDQYKSELGKNGFKTISFEDLTNRALDYWLIREKFRLASGVEHCFIKAYKNKLMKYVFHLALKIS